MRTNKNRDTRTPSTSFPHRNRRPKIVVASLVLAILLAGGAVYALHQHAVGTSAQKTNSNTPTINNSPATPQEKKSSEDNKDRIVEQQKNADKSTSSGSTTSVKPIITHAGVSGSQVEIDSFVGDVVEDGGTCTLTAVNGSETITRTTTGVANATTTVCPSFNIQKSAFSPSGEWNVTVSYKSKDAAGTSDTTKLTIN